MGIYNCSATLQEALDSLYVQTFQDFEIILCEDGSVDDTYDIARKNHLAHPDRIVLLRNERNMGLNVTLNRCLQMAGSEYVARMDGDDVSLPERFEKQVRFLDTHPEYAIVSTPMIRFDENGEFARGRGGDAPTKLDFIEGTPFCHAPSMVRREAYLAVGGYTEDVRLIRVEDYNLWMKMYALGYRGYNLPECLYKVREDRACMSRKRSDDLWRDIFHNNETYAHLLACKVLDLPLKGYVYCFLPIVKRLIPRTLFDYCHKRKLQMNQ